MEFLDKPSSLATTLKTLLEKNLSYKQAVALWVLSRHFDSLPDFSHTMHPDYAVVVNSLAVLLKDETKKDDEDE